MSENLKRDTEAFWADVLKAAGAKALFLRGHKSTFQTLVEKHFGAAYSVADHIAQQRGAQ